MSEHAASRLQDYPFKTVRLACSKCDRQQRFSKDKLVVEYGAGVTMLDLLPQVLRCDWRHAPRRSCGLFYPDLVRE